MINPTDLAEADYHVECFRRQCERDEKLRAQVERWDRIEADRYETDVDYYEYALAQAGARRW